MTNARKHNRRKTSDYFVVEDRSSGEVIGRVLDMSTDGLRLMTLEPVGISSRYGCVIKLTRPIDGCCEIRFEAECRWCLENTRAGWYEAGFKINDITPRTVALIRQLLQDWVAAESKRHNNADREEEKERRDSPLLYSKAAFRDSSPVTGSHGGPRSRR